MAVIDILPEAADVATVRSPNQRNVSAADLAILVTCDGRLWRSACLALVQQVVGARCKVDGNVRSNSACRHRYTTLELRELNIEECLVVQVAVL